MMTLPIRLWCLLSYVMICGTHEKKPNFLLIVADDLGWGDLASYGHPTQEWNAIDEMASHGIRFTQFYSPASFCTPSRAALLTGRLPIRYGLYGYYPVFLPQHSTGLPKEEITIAEHLRDNGYHTGIVGKWHLGINEFDSKDGRHLPNYHGFDYLGTILPFSLETVCDTTGRHRDRPLVSRCFLYRNTSIVEQPFSFHNLTATLVEDTNTFLLNHKQRNIARRISDTEDREQPFFLYLSLPQTHTPMFNDHRFKGKSKRGEYGDQIEEMAWAVDETIKTLRNLSLENDTLVIFISDHGPHKEMCAEGGNTGPLRGGKATYLDGGLRIPAIAFWPGTVEAGRISPVVANLMDIYQTFADLSGSKSSPDIKRDSYSLVDTLVKPYPSRKPSREIMFFYCGKQLNAVRYKAYKIHFYSQKIIKDEDYKLHCKNGISNLDFYNDSVCEAHTKLAQPLIYNVEKDPGELYPLEVSDHLGVLREAEQLIQVHSKSLEISEIRLLDREFTSSRLIPCCNPPYCVCS